MIMATSNIQKYMLIEKGLRSRRAYLRLALLGCDNQGNSSAGRMSDAYR